MIELTGVQRTYFVGGSPVYALRELNLSIASGEYVTIMGPSGSGKSTLLHILGCLDRPDSGSYRFAGEETARLTDVQLSCLRRDQIGFVFQFFHLVPRLTSAGNVESAHGICRGPAGGAPPPRAPGARCSGFERARRPPPGSTLRRRTAARRDCEGDSDESWRSCWLTNPPGISTAVQAVKS